MSRKVLLPLAVVSLALLSGCMERKLVISSDPPGAKVVINQKWEGVTPFTLPFKHHGTYDIRISKAGYYPMVVKEPIVAGLHQKPFLDFPAEVLPVRGKDIRKLHYTLEQIADPDAIDEIMTRRTEMRERTERISEMRMEHDKNRKPTPIPLPVKKKDEEEKEEEKNAAESNEPPAAAATPPEPAKATPESSGAEN